MNLEKVILQYHTNEIRHITIDMIAYLLVPRRDGDLKEYKINLNTGQIGQIKIGTIKINIFTNATGLDFHKSYEMANDRLVESKHSLKYLCKKDYLRNIKLTNTKWDF